MWAGLLEEQPLTVEPSLRFLGTRLLKALFLLPLEERWKPGRLAAPSVNYGAWDLWLPNSWPPSSLCSVLLEQKERRTREPMAGDRWDLQGWGGGREHQQDWQGKDGEMSWVARWGRPTGEAEKPERGWSYLEIRMEGVRECCQILLPEHFLRELPTRSATRTCFPKWHPYRLYLGPRATHCFCPSRWWWSPPWLCPLWVTRLSVLSGRLSQNLLNVLPLLWPQVQSWES